MSATLPREAALQSPPGWFTRWFGQGRIGLFGVSQQALARRYALPQSRWATVALPDCAGARFHYTDEGVADGEPLVLIHGFGASLHTWEGLMPALRRHYRVLRFDLPPFGLSGPLRDVQGRIVTMDVDRYRAVIDGFLAAVGIARATFVGSSLGGLIAWDLAVRAPARVQRLVLIGAAGFPMKLPVWIDLFRHASVRWSAPWMLPEAIVRAATRDVYGDASRISEATFRRYVDLFHAAGVREAVGRMVPKLDFDTLPTEGLRGVRAPTLVMWGERDRWIPPAHADAFVQRIAGARLRRYAGLGHIPMEEDPRPVAADLLSFLQETSS